MIVSNKHKDTLDNLIDSFNIQSANLSEFLDLLKSCNKVTYNISRSKSASSTFLGKNYLNKDIAIKLLQLEPKNQDFHIYKSHNIVLLSS